jgi:hypothetical protein
MIVSRRLFAVLTLMTLSLFAAAAANAKSSTVKPIPLTLRRVATVNLAQVARNPAAQPLTAPAIDPSLYATAVNRRIPRASLSSAAGAAAQIRAALLAPSKAPSISFAPSSAPQIFGFSGLDAIDTAIGNGLDVNAPNVGFGIEPPDQGLCVGNGTVIEMTNLEYREFNASGTPLGAAINLSTIFGVSSADFLSDPKCYYDQPTNTFFMTLTDLTDLTDKSFLLVGVMPVGSSTVTTYEIETTNDGTDGTPSDSGCPCFGDQPLLGADANAIVVSLNEFSQPQNPAGAFNGAEIYLISKSDLVAAVTDPSVTVLTFLFEAPIPLAEGIGISMEPAASPDGAFDTANGGTEFLMNSLDFFGAGDDRLAVWAIINTCVLASPACAGPLSITAPPRILHVHTYRDPFSARQPAATTMIPYGNATGNFTVEQIDANDDRLGQVVYANGKLYAALDTLVRVGGVLHAGIEYFIVKPVFHAKGPFEFGFSARLLRSHYVARSGIDISYPSIGVTTGGNAVMAFSLMGKRRYPSAGWMPIAKAGPKQIHAAAAGAGPDDGFTGYPNDNSIGSRVARWGDYSAAVADGKNIWMAAEYIPSACDDAAYAIDLLCGMTRAPEANWGTFISELPVP